MLVFDYVVSWGMRLTTKCLATEGLVLEVPLGEGPPLVLELGPGSRLGGELALEDGCLHVRVQKEAEFFVPSLSAKLPGMKVLAGGPVRLSGVYGELMMPLHKASEAQGSISVARLELPSVGLGFPNIGIRFTATLHELRASRSAGAPWEVTVKRMELSSLECRLDIDQLTVAKVERSVPNEDGRSVLDGVDLSLLDFMGGYINVDVAVEAQAPVLGSVARDYLIRVPVDNGMVNFRKLERSLGVLEDAVLDFEVEPGRLILEFDPLPLATFDNTTLCSWSLSADADQALAARDLVRMSVLASPNIDAMTGKSSSDKPRDVDDLLRRLHVDEIDVVVALEGGTRLQLYDALLLPLGDDEGGKAIERLRMRGNLRHDADGTTPGQLDLELEGGAARVDKLTIPGIEGSTGCFELRQANLKLAFDGLSPRMLDGSLRELNISDMVLRLGR